MLNNFGYIVNLKSKKQFSIELLLNKRYEISSKLGQGAIGEVFKAYDVLKGEIVALKIAKPDPISEEKITNEFKITSQFKHPNIIAVFDFGTIRVCDESKFISRKFIALEYCDVFDISNLIPKLSFKEKIEIIYQISHALHIIHKAGYVHRDLKLENILFDSKTSTAKITDLGLAIEYESIIPNEMSVGTLLYISPEILRGEKYDQRADIYSLGILIYYILTGSSPFESNSPIEIVKWHLSQKSLNLENFNPELQELLNSMLDPEPSHRPKDVSRVIAVLKKLNSDLKEIKDFKIRKPFGKDENIKKAIEILNEAKSPSPKSNIILIVGADGLGKTSLIRYIDAEAKSLGFETLSITELNIPKILNLLRNSPFTLELTPELRLRFEKLSEASLLNPHMVIELSQFLRELLLNSSLNFPVALFIDDITLDEPLSEIFIKSFLIPEEFSQKNIAIFITCSDLSLYSSFLSSKFELLHLRPLNIEELRRYININFDLDDETAQKFAEALAEYTYGISAAVEIFSYYISNKIKNGFDAISEIAKIKFDEILNRVKQLSPNQRKILDILSLEDEPVQIEILKKFFDSEITRDLLQLQAFGAVKIENDKAAISYKALKKHIENTLDEEKAREIHLNYATIYLNRTNSERKVDKILYHFAKAKDKKGIEKFAEKGIENLISKNEFQKAISLCEELLNLLSDCLKPSLKIKLASLNIKTGNYEKVISILEDVEELAALELKLESYFHLGNIDEAIKTLNYALKITDTIYDRVRILTKISQIYASSGDVETAFKILKSLESEPVLKFIAKTETIGDIYAGLGITSQMKGEIEKAKRYFELSLEHRLEKKNTPKIIAAYNNIANFYSITAQYDKAIKYWKKALEISESSGDIIQSAHIYNNIGINYFKRKKYDKAVESYQKALVIYKMRNDIPGIANVLGNMGELLIDEFKLGEAYTNIKEARGLYEKIGNNDGLCEMNLLLLTLYLNVGALNKSESLLNEIKKEKCNISKHLLNYNYALVEMKKGNFDKAESILVELAELDEVRMTSELYLKILISLLKLSYVKPISLDFEEISSTVSALAKEIDDLRLRSLNFFILSLYHENKDKVLAFDYLNQALNELGDEFSEFKWKIYLKIAQYYKTRGVDVKFLYYFEKALVNFQELIERIKEREFIKSYLDDPENREFVELLRNLNI